ncbi:MAG: hypothetical protein JSS49_04350 [Planctomycetes bacterium]|nr:hypothetical protein [Planctomycetota bacterium]
MQSSRGTFVMRRMMILALVFACSTPTLAADPETVSQIRQQINALQQQLEALENAPAAKRNVTQIGASRGRNRTTTGMVVRIYDLGDLFAVAPPYPARTKSDLELSPAQAIFPTAIEETQGKGMGGMGGMGGGMFSIPPTGTLSLGAAAARQVSGDMDSIETSQAEMIRVIRETISPDLWSEGGKITKLGNAFIISADEDTHQQIEALLNLFRSRWGTLRTVSVRAWWISLAPADIQSLLDTPTESAVPDGPPVFGVVGDDAWKQILNIWRQPPAEEAHRLRYQATLTCYNGQTVSTMSGSQSLAVGAMRAIATRAENGGQLGYQPEVVAIQEGLAFQVTPITNISGKTVLLDIHSRLTLPMVDGKATKAEPNASKITPADVAQPISRRRLNIHRLSTTARVPVDRPYLIGGMSLPDAETEGLQLYLFVKISVQELRNDQDQHPIDPAAPVDATTVKEEKPAEEPK